MTRFPTTRNLSEPPGLRGAEVPGGSPLRGEEPAGTELGACRRNALDPTAACPMCAASGERYCAVLGCTITCPWCAGRAVVSLWRARALRAQLRSKAERSRQQTA